MSSRKKSATAATKPKQITLTIQNTEKVTLKIAGEGIMNIDWGDGIPCETHTLSDFEYLGDPFGYFDTGEYDWNNDAERFMYNNDYQHNQSKESSITLSITADKIVRFICCSNQLIKLDVSKNTALPYLECKKNQLTNLYLSKNMALRYLDCNSNQLPSLDISKNTALRVLSCNNNQLTCLDLSSNTKLIELDCSKNPLTNLNISANTALELLACNFNQLTSLDVNANTKLQILICENNELTSLDFSKNTSLTRLHCAGNQLSADALNNLFESLPFVKMAGVVDIRQNPGTSACNISIAENKGWKIYS